MDYIKFISDCIKGDVYAAGRLTHAHYLLNDISERFSSRSQLENVLNTIF